MKSEFGFIEKLRNRSLTSKIGDDCAVVPKDSEIDLVITTDLLIEDIDFRIDWTQPEFLGHKALAVSLSDVAAMGAKPVWSMLSIGIPEKIWKTDFVERFYDGYFRLAEKFNVKLIGGDVSRTPDKIVVDSIAAGEVKKGNAVLRSGAKAGDLIFVTGQLGGAARSLKLLENGERFAEEINFPLRQLLLRQLAPNPQIEIGQILGADNLATAMIDLSDGLSGDLRHLCRESKTGAKIFFDKIPIDKNIDILEKSDCALNGGEDFELLFTVNPKKISRLEKQLKNFAFSRVGEITANIEIIELVDGNETTILQPKGFRHF
ncbi:MAG: thiamine-phosphate kinase [Acidobacteriota bacterium]|nr:thiamine-phosphate kinase [Acidobacteriota bacterium]